MFEKSVMRTEELVPYSGNVKRHTEAQVDMIAASIEEFGFCDPIAVWHRPDGSPEIVEGHGRLLALQRLGMEEVPVIILDHLSESEKRAYAIAHNELTLSTGFDFSILDEEVANIGSIDMGLFGFDVPEPAPYRGGTGEIDVTEFSEGGYAHKCDNCGFLFN